MREQVEREQYIVAQRHNDVDRLRDIELEAQRRVQDAELEANASRLELIQSERRVQGSLVRVKSLEDMLRIGKQGGMDADKANAMVALEDKLGFSEAQRSQQELRIQHLLGEVQRLQVRAKPTMTATLPWAELLSRCEDACFALAHANACCGGPEQAAAQLPQSCGVVALVSEGQAEPPAHCTASEEEAPAAPSSYRGGLLSRGKEQPLLLSGP